MYISETDKIVIRQLIEQQLQAFQKNDEETAFALTSPALHRKFSLPDFMSKIKLEYDAIVQHRSIMFQGFTLVNNYPALVAMVMSQKGELAKAIFIVQQQKDYSWLIHDYELVAADEKIR